MKYQLNEQQKSMMQSVSKNIKGFILDPQPIHSSTHGEIFTLTHPQTQQSLVLKVLFKRRIKNYKNERKIHKELKNRYIVQLQNCFEDEFNAYIVMERCQSNLKDTLQSKLSLQMVREISLQVARGIHYLHKNQLVHHGIRSDNILLNQDTQVKICDFGEAVKIEEGKLVKSCMKNIAYAPPQAADAHDQKFDVWSLGCLIYEMVTGTTPFQVHKYKQLNSILNHQYLNNFQYDESLPPILVNLLRKIFIFDRKQRISIEKVIKHSFFTGGTLQEQKEEDRPLAVKKRSKTSNKSVEVKGKENTDRVNRVHSRRNMPSYREMLDKKCKKQELPCEVGSLSDKYAPQKTVSQELKGQRSLKTNTMHNLYQRAKEEIVLKKRGLSPLNTLKMRINPLRIKNTEIRIDREGLTRMTTNKQITQLINISPDGKHILMQKGTQKKGYSLQTLPTSYHPQYQQCKRILKQIQIQQPRITYTDRSFMGDQVMILSVMYSNLIRISIEEKMVIKDIGVMEMLANKGNLSTEMFKAIEDVYMMLSSKKLV